MHKVRIRLREAKFPIKEVSRLMATKKLRKKQKLRNNEYYNTQKTYDILYEKSKQNSSFKKLYEIITSEENILLAYRNIKRNKGSKTKGTNKTTVIDIGYKEPEKVISYVRNRVQLPIQRKH